MEGGGGGGGVGVADLWCRMGSGCWGGAVPTSPHCSCAFVTYEKMESADQAMAEVGAAVRELWGDTWGAPKR